MDIMTARRAGQLLDEIGHAVAVMNRFDNNQMVPTDEESARNVVGVEVCEADRVWRESITKALKAKIGEMRLELENL